jgi:hypothetical protein
MAVKQLSVGFETEPRAWAWQQWARVKLADNRLERRAIELGYRMTLAPGASLPRQMADPAALKAAYRFLSNQRVSHVALSQVHWQNTRQAAREMACVLLVQDGSELDYTHYAQTMAGLGSVGDRRFNSGLLLHTTLGVLPEPRRVLGIMHQQVVRRQLIPEGTGRRQRPKAERESRLWGEAVQAIGGPPAGVHWVVVADRAADDMEFLLRCREQGCDVNLRIYQDRRLITEDAQAHYLLATVRSWPVATYKMVDIRGRGGRPARQARIAISYGQVQVRIRPHNQASLVLWIVRAAEVEPPPGSEPLEWILATTIAVETPADAEQRVDWYTARWLVEDYHQCLKTGCAIEQRDFEDAERIQRLLGFLALVAVRLLQLREDARLDPEAPANTAVDPLIVKLLAAKFKRSPESMTLRTFWRSVAQLGGYLGRRSDGEPGWKTLWQGWLQLEALAEGVRLAATLADP